MKCKGESWRPKSGAARTKDATTPARIAEGGAPATKMYSHTRASVVGLRKMVGTAKRRKTRETMAVNTATCWPDIARTCVLPQNHTTSGFRFSALLTTGPEDMRFERVGAD